MGPRTHPDRSGSRSTPPAQTNPTATLLLNDFDMSTAYECLIEGVLEAGIQVDAIGLQSHMHQGYWGEEKTLAILDRFARFGLPLHLTETTLLSGDLMPAHIEDLNDYQVAVVAVDARGRGAAGRRDRAALPHPGRAPRGAGGDVLGDHRRRHVARRARRARPRRRHAQARVRRAAPAGQGRVVAGADDAADVRPTGACRCSGFLGTYTVDGTPFSLERDGEVVVRLEG